MPRPFLVLDIDGVLQAPRLKYGFEQQRVIEERIPPSDVHPLLRPRGRSRPQPFVCFRTPVRTSPRLFADLAALDADVVMLTTWLEHESSRRFLAQATPGHTWFPDAVHLPFPGRAEDGSLPADWKAYLLRDLLHSHPRAFIWADDDEVPVHSEAISAEFSQLPALFIAPDSATGLTPSHVDQMKAFVASVT